MHEMIGILVMMAALAGGVVALRDAWRRPGDGWSRIQAETRTVSRQWARRAVRWMVLSGPLSFWLTYVKNDRYIEVTMSTSRIWITSVHD